jgi:lipoprotein-anchoring transpeptidase ErfK/SrfK
MERQNGRAAAKQTSLILFSLFTLVFASSTVAQTATPAASDRAKRTVLVSVPDRKLAVIEDGNVIARFSVAVGAAASPSPTGEFQIVTRVSNPTYYHAGKAIPTGKDNALGTRWLGLSQKSYGIHGTNAPSSVGHAKSHGCIRLRNRDAERLFAMLQIGDVVQIRGERDEQISQTFGDGADDTTVAEAQASTQASGQ